MKVNVNLLTEINRALIQYNLLHAKEKDLFSSYTKHNISSSFSPNVFDK